MDEKQQAVLEFVNYLIQSDPNFQGLSQEQAVAQLNQMAQKDAEGVRAMFQEFQRQRHGEEKPAIMRNGGKLAYIQHLSAGMRNR